MRIDGIARDRAAACRTAVVASLGATLLGVGALYASPATAMSVCVRVASYVETMPDGSTATMWGYQTAPTCTDDQLASLTSAINQKVRSPGDAIAVPATESSLTVTLINRASADGTLGETELTEPTSFVLQGHNTTPTMTPVFTTGAGADCTPPAVAAPPADATAPSMAVLLGLRDCRVRSFTHEAAAGGIAVYTFNTVRPGTYMYQSGTMPQIQVQMGLYGLVRKNFAEVATNTPAYAYPTLPFDNEIALLLSEVDPAVHAAVAAGTFTGSTIGYDPKYFRLHRYNPPGLPATTTLPAAQCGVATNREVNACIKPAIDFTERSLAIAGPPPLNERGRLAIQPGVRQLVRLVNAGIQSRALELIDGHWYVVAEEGNEFPYRREQYSAFLPAAKTADVWFTPTTSSPGQQLTIFDRRMALTNNNADPSGGQLIRLNLSVLP